MSSINAVLSGSALPELPASIPRALLVMPFLLAVLGGCSLHRLAVDKLSDAIAQSGTSYASDDDLELIGAAAPFSLKLMESLLAEAPAHRGLLLAATSGFTQYAYAFVHQKGDEIEQHDLAAARMQRERARRLYVRASDYGLRGLEAKYPGFSKALRADAAIATRRLRADDAPLAYWTAASWAAAISLSKDRPEVVADLGLMEALIERALELDESYDYGAIHAFFVSYAMSRPNGGPHPASSARRHFERAVELSQGLQAGPYVAFAESVCVALQNRREFERLLATALAVDIDARPQWKLANAVMQRRARWLLARANYLFAD